MQLTRVVIAVLLIFGPTTRAQQLQPRITTLESFPARRSSGIISLPEGSPWCFGYPTIWLPGHKDRMLDRPLCLVPKRRNETMASSSSELARIWTTKPDRAFLDITDPLNEIDNIGSIDRHQCGLLDINGDGCIDIYCLVGANKGRGVGFAELYLTHLTDGSVSKVPQHGLQKFIGMRSRHTVVLKGQNRTDKFVFVSTHAQEREDGMFNRHAMFRINGRRKITDFNSSYFDYEWGPWERHLTRATCAIVADVNEDGLDDLFLCSGFNETSSLYVQTSTGKFRVVNLGRGKSHHNIRNARIADVDGDGLPDLTTVEFGEVRSTLRVHLGIHRPPFFNLTGTYLSQRLPNAAPDIEILDVNADGAMDIYVVQANERPPRIFGTPNYCGGHMTPSEWFTGGPDPNTPPDDYRPPEDIAHDFLFLGNRNATSPMQRFSKVKMRHHEPGCGYYVKSFGERSLILAQGGFVRPGHNLLLEW